MIQIKPVSDLRNKFPEPVVIGIEHFSTLADDTEKMLDEADKAAAASGVRYSHDEVFSRLKGGLCV
jgi:hypothetical protein